MKTIKKIFPRSLQMDFTPTDCAAMHFAQRTITLRRECGLMQQSFADATGIHAAHRFDTMAPTA